MTLQYRPLGSGRSYFARYIFVLVIHAAILLIVVDYMRCDIVKF